MHPYIKAVKELQKGWKKTGVEVGRTGGAS